jgi:hypothetical protein
MKKILVCGGIGAGAILSLLGAGCATETGGAQQTSNAPASEESENVGFNELSTEDMSLDVRASHGAQLALRRRAPLSYEVEYVAPSGARTSLALPVVGRINPLVDARNYGATTLACVNSFRGRGGDAPSVECLLLNSETGTILQRKAVANVWLRTLSEDRPKAYLSPQELFHFDNEGNLVCHALELDHEGQLTLDQGFLTSCDERTVRVPPDRRRQALELTPLPSRVSPPTNLAMQARQPPPSNSGTRTGPTSEPSEAPSSSSPPPSPPSPGATPPPAPPGATPSPDGEPNAPPKSVVCKAPIPTSNRKEQTVLGFPDLPGLDRIATSYKKTDWPYPGAVFGIRINADGELNVASDEPLCLHREVSGWGGGDVFVSFGPLLGSGSVYGEVGKKSCGTLDCGNGKEWTCSGPEAESRRSLVKLDTSFGGSLPLDVFSYLRPLCGRKEVSCNLDIIGNFGYARRHDEWSGKAICGSGCEDGKSTSYDDERTFLGATGALELEFSAGLLIPKSQSRKIHVNGNAGIQYEVKWSSGTMKQTTCDGESAKSYECRDQLATFYASGCIGQTVLNYCFDFRKVLFFEHSGNCPPLESASGGMTPGAMAGQTCRGTSDKFFTWETYADQCRNCCASLPAPDPAIQDLKEFNQDCNATCSDLDD